jgi:phage FluMu gp28-like protein
MYEELPFYLKPGVVEYNKQSIEFENGSKIETAGTTEDTFRGRSVALLLLDELGFVSDGIAREFYTSVYPAISSSDEAKIIIISTPNGVFNLFHEIYSGAEAKRNEYKHMKVTWDMIPGRTKT